MRDTVQIRDTSGVRDVYMHVVSRAERMLYGHAPWAVRHLNVWTHASSPRWNASRQETVPDYRWLNEMRKWSLYNNSTVRNVNVIILIKLTRKGRAMERCTRAARCPRPAVRCPLHSLLEIWELIVEDPTDELAPERARRGGARQGRRARHGAHACSRQARGAIATEIAN